MQARLARSRVRERSMRAARLAALRDRELLQSSRPRKAPGAARPGREMITTLRKGQRPPFPNLPARSGAEWRWAKCEQRECENLQPRARALPGRNHIRALSTPERGLAARIQPNR